MLTSLITGRCPTPTGLLATPPYGLSAQKRGKMGRMKGLPGMARLARMAKLYRLVHDSELFDASWYRRQSAGAKLFPNPVVHYALAGWKQRLNPSPRFDTAFYWDSYRDVRQLGANPLVHYLLHGHKEGRLATTTGKAVRAAHIPHDTPLPLFTAPSANMTRLSVVIDDHTPYVVGLGFSPLVTLAAATAARHNWMLRVIIRSTTIDRHLISEAMPPMTTLPQVDVVVRSPGPTADVECVEGEYWWATSATSRASLRDFVKPEELWWIVVANEADRHPAGELRLLVTSQLADPDVRTIFVDKALHSALSPQGPATVLDEDQGLFGLNPSPTTPATIGVIADEGSSDNLFVHSLKLVEDALARAVIDPETWNIAVIGSVVQPVTLTGNVVPRLANPTTPTDWVTEVESCSVIISLGAGTEPAYLARQAQAAGIPAVVSDCAQPFGPHLIETLRKALEAKKPGTVSPLASPENVAAQLDSLWSDSR